MALGTDVGPGDRIAWVTDIGWMMGPWLIYGATLLGATIVLYDGAADYPNRDRLWDICARKRVGILGISPTLVRAMSSQEGSPRLKFDLSHLRILASTGEPWNPDPWWWLFEKVGGKKLPIINYSGGTEISGGILMGNPLTPIKPCSFSGPCPGIAADVVDENGCALRNGVGELIIRQPWIGMARGFWNDPERYIQTYGDTIHSFISNRRYEGPFMPGYEPMSMPGKNAGILRVDHIVGNVELGKMNAWADWYNHVLGFHRYMTFDDKDISTEYSALMSIVMANDSAALKMPINEPAEGRRKSQIQEYLDFYQGPRVQHIALLTEDIVKSVDTMRSSGISFLKVPDSYYEALPARIGKIKENTEDIRSLGILADRDQGGYLLQIFTEPVADRPTLFFEIIQRNGSREFGKGNFKALFEAIEREQARRGNL